MNRAGMQIFTETFVYILFFLTFFLFIAYATLFGTDPQTEEITEAYSSGEAHMILTGLLRTTADTLTADTACLRKQSTYTIGDAITMMEVSQNAKSPVSRDDLQYYVRSALKPLCDDTYCVWKLAIETPSTTFRITPDNPFGTEQSTTGSAVNPASRVDEDMREGLQRFGEPFNPDSWDRVNNAHTHVPTCAGTMRLVNLTVMHDE